MRGVPPTPPLPVRDKININASIRQHEVDSPISACAGSTRGDCLEQDHIGFRTGYCMVTQFVDGLSSKKTLTRTAVTTRPLRYLQISRNTQVPHSVAAFSVVALSVFLSIVCRVPVCVLFLVCQAHQSSISLARHSSDWGYISRHHISKQKTVRQAIDKTSQLPTVLCWDRIAHIDALVGRLVVAACSRAGIAGKTAIEQI